MPVVVMKHKPEIYLKFHILGKYTLSYVEVLLLIVLLSHCGDHKD